MNYEPLDLLLSVTDGNGKILETHIFDSARLGVTFIRANGVGSVTVQYTVEGQAQIISCQNIATA